jgi:hypothetical protein
MKSVRLGWVLIAILLINISVGAFWNTPMAGRAEHSGGMGSEAATRHIPAELRIDRETASLPKPDISSPAAFLPLQMSGPSEDSHPRGTPEYIHHAPIDILQLQHVLRI